jgi:hypothetical protein
MIQSARALEHGKMVEDRWKGKLTINSSMYYTHIDENAVVWIDTPKHTDALFKRLGMDVAGLPIRPVWNPRATSLKGAWRQSRLLAKQLAAFVGTSSLPLEVWVYIFVLALNIPTPPARIVASDVPDAVNECAWRRNTHAYLCEVPFSGSVKDMNRQLRDALAAHALVVDWHGVERRGDRAILRIHLSHARYT